MTKEEAAAQAAAEKKVADEMAAAKAAEAKAAPPTPPAAKPSKAEDLISQANAAAVRQEQANKELATLLDRQEEMKVEATLGGETEAGQPTQTDEEKSIAQAKELIAGTGFEEQLFPEEKPNGAGKKAA